MERKLIKIKDKTAIGINNIDCFTIYQEDIMDDTKVHMVYLSKKDLKKITKALEEV